MWYILRPTSPLNERIVLFSSSRVRQWPEEIEMGSLSHAASLCRWHHSWFSLWVLCTSYEANNSPVEWTLATCHGHGAVLAKALLWWYQGQKVKSAERLLCTRYESRTYPKTWPITELHRPHQCQAPTSSFPAQCNCWLPSSHTESWRYTRQYSVFCDRSLCVTESQTYFLFLPKTYDYKKYTWDSHEPRSNLGAGNQFKTSQEKPVVGLTVHLPFIR